MSQRFFNPYPQFFDSSPNVYSGGKLYFYAAGTDTPLDTYSNTGLTIANTNPVVLGSAGRSSTDIYLQDLYYKIILKDSAETTIWTVDNYYQKDPSKTSIRLVGSGSPNGAQAGTAGSSGILPTEYWDYTNSILYVCTTTGSSSTAVWTAINASTATAAFSNPQGRLTLTTATPVISSDVTAATAVYYTPTEGNLVPLYNGSLMIPTEFSELTLTLVSSHTANTIYDVFVFSNSGVVTLATGPAWTTSTAGAGARGTGSGTTQLTRIKGLNVNAVSMTGRNGATTYTIAANKGTYLGSIFIDGSAGQVSCHTSYGQSRKWGVWNAFNRKRIALQGGDPSGSWNYGTATIRSSNNSLANQLIIFSGLAEESTMTSFSQALQNTTSANQQIGIGYNTASSFSSMVGNFLSSGGVTIGSTLQANYVAVPAIGINNINACEKGGGSGTQTFNGQSGAMLLTAMWMG